VRTISRVVIAVVAVFGLAACSTEDSTVATGTASPTASPTASTSSTASPTASTSESAQPTASPSVKPTDKAVKAYVYALPAGVIVDSNEAIAWEALMSPVGEYAASAMYQAVIDKFGQVEPYVTIRVAEERHISALIRQLDRYGVKVPANPYLGAVAAPAKLQAAAEAWAVGEIENVTMYDKLLGKSSDSNLNRVLTNLRASSQNSHLPLFEAAAENGGTLTLEQMNAIQGR
jgi:hypothetical protein